MSIHDFHAKLMGNDDNAFLSVLRKLSRVQDTRSMIQAMADSTLGGEWANWDGNSAESRSFSPV
ncbi:MAG TPA: hypothetical protein VOA87_03990 [Thermoanaerobaculia bacterium]|nr:hypothetical protein [Thermoanaerobaculia bacterium]